MNEMVKDIRAEMEKILNKIDWMDDMTRERAKDKLRTMKEYIGYPEEILKEHLLEELYEVSICRLWQCPQRSYCKTYFTFASPQDLEVGAGDHFNNGIRMSKWGTNYAWKKLREKVEKN